jgi:two-component system OmpR family response regulator
MRIIVVEDDPEVAEFLVRVLRESAWAPDAVRTGEAALAAMRATAYDLMVLDLGLPGIDGFAVCRARNSLTAKGLAR